MRGNTYSIEFEIDPRKCEIFSILATFMQHFTKDDGFKIVDNNTIKKEDLITMQMDFEEKDPRTKSNNWFIQHQILAESPLLALWVGTDPVSG